MNLRQLEYFVKVAETLNYTKAAGQLYVSQSAVTKQIRLLEEELEAELFERNHKSVKLTMAGELFYQDALDILSDIERSRNRIKSFEAGEEGSLRFGYVNGLERTNLLAAVQQFYREHPRCHVSYDNDTSYVLRDKLLKGNMDLILTHRPPEDDEYQKIEVFRSPMMVFVSKESELCGRAFFKEEDLPAVRGAAVCRSAFDSGAKAMAMDHALMRAMGQEEIAVLPEFSIEYTQFQKYLTRIPIAGMEMTFFAVSKRDSRNPLAGKFTALLKENFQS